LYINLSKQNFNTTILGIKNTNSSYLYCVGDGLNKTYYSTGVNNGTISNWIRFSGNYPTTPILWQQNCITDGKYIYCIGGWSGGYSPAATFNGVYSARLSNGTTPYWTKQINYPIGITSHSCALYNAYIYCIGGANNSGQKLDNVYSARASNGTVSNWTKLANFPRIIEDSSCVAYSSYLYCIGGDNGTIATNYSNKVFSARLSNGTIYNWTRQTNSPVDVQQLSCVAYANYVYCIGGLINIHNQTSNGYTSLAAGYLIYSAKLSSGIIQNWTKLVNYPAIIAGQSCTAYNGYVYCIGGYNYTLIKVTENYTSNGDQNAVYSAKLSNGSISNWASQINYPISESGLSCIIAR